VLALSSFDVIDTIAPEFLQLLSTHYTWIEWGFLFRPDLEGTPRYPTAAWVDRLVKVNREAGSFMRLAGHLCKSRCQEILSGDYTFVKSLATRGFGRVQVNATVANGVFVDPSKIDEYVANIRICIQAVPEVEWIIQANEETKPIWERLVVPIAQSAGASTTMYLPSNMSILYDASCGKGELATSYPQPLTISTTTSSNAAGEGSGSSSGVIHVPCGYAGGMGPSTIHSVLTALRDSTNGTRVWVDMESRLRTLTVSAAGAEPVDIFDINKCYECVQIGVQFGLPVSKFSLLSV
jgi:hypothetical protein